MTVPGQRTDDVRTGSHVSTRLHRVVYPSPRSCRPGTPTTPPPTFLKEGLVGLNRGTYNTFSDRCLSYLGATSQPIFTSRPSGNALRPSPQTGTGRPRERKNHGTPTVTFERRRKRAIWESVRPFDTVDPDFLRIGVSRTVLSSYVFSPSTVHPDSPGVCRGLLQDGHVTTPSGICKSTRTSPLDSN